MGKLEPARLIQGNPQTSRSNGGTPLVPPFFVICHASRSDTYAPLRKVALGDAGTRLTSSAEFKPATVSPIWSMFAGRVSVYLLTQTLNAADWPFTVCANSTIYKWSVCGGPSVAAPLRFDRARMCEHGDGLSDLRWCFSVHI